LSLCAYLRTRLGFAIWAGGFWLFLPTSCHNFKYGGMIIDHRVEPSPAIQNPMTKTIVRFPNNQTPFIRLIIRTFQLVFSAGLSTQPNGENSDNHFPGREWDHTCMYHACAPFYKYHRQIPDSGIHICAQWIGQRLISFQFRVNAGMLIHQLAFPIIGNALDSQI
jgi:hypothetical protein